MQADIGNEEQNVTRIEEKLVLSIHINSSIRWTWQKKCRDDKGQAIATLFLFKTDVNINTKLRREAEISRLPTKLKTMNN